MKNKFLIFLFFLLYYSGSLFCQQQNPFNVEVKYPLKGINTYCPKDNRLIDSSYYEYDSNQKLSYISNFQLSGFKVHRSSKISLNGKDSIVSFREIVFDEESINIKKEYGYTSIYRTIFFGDTLAIRMQYFLNNDTSKVGSMLLSYFVENKLSYQIKKTRIKDSLTSTDSTAYSYINNVLAKKEIYNTSCNCVINKTEYAYLPDSVYLIKEYFYTYVEEHTFYKGKLVSSKKFYLDSTKGNRIEYDYKNGLLICKEVIYDNFQDKRNDIKEIYQYDEFKRPIFRHSFSNNFKRGRLLNSFEWDGDKLTKKYKYPEDIIDLGMDMGGCQYQRLEKYSYYK